MKKAKKGFFLILLCGSLCCLGACQTESSDRVLETETSETVSATTGQAQELEVTSEKSQTAASLLEGVLTKSTLLLANEEYDIEIDYPVYAESSDVAYTSNGYYFFSSDGFLCFMDRESGQCVKVCAQLNCTHEGEDCDACFSGSAWRTEQGIWYNEGYLYVLKTESANEYTLIRFAEDGSGREVVTSLFELESGEYNTEIINSMIVHRGYLYYSLTDSKMSSGAVLYRCKLEVGAEPEEYYVFPYAQSCILRIKGVDAGVFFEIGFYVNGNTADADEYYGILCYVEGDNEPVLVLEDIQYDYTIAGNEIIYGTYEGIYAYNFVEGTKRTVAELGLLCHLSYDGEYIWADDWIGTLFSEKVSGAERQIYKLDLEGNILASWNIARQDTSIWSYFGDERYLFLLWTESTDEMAITKLRAFDKATEEWVDLEWS